MTNPIANLLYRRPELYEFVYPEPDFSTPRFCRKVFHRHLGRDPRSILDIGCGTGRDLAKLEEWCHADCVGMDDRQTSRWGDMEIPDARAKGNQSAQQTKGLVGL